MADIKWIKVMTDMFDNRKIKQIETFPEGDTLIVIWLKLLCLAGNVNEQGVISFTKNMPYTVDMLATELNRPLNTIRLALQTFEQFGMIENVDGFISISNWEKYQNIDGMNKVREQTRKRVAEYRKRQKLLLESKSNVTSNVTVTNSNATDKEEEKEIDIDIETPTTTKNITLSVLHNYGTNGNVKLTEAQLKKLWKEFGIDDVNRTITRLDDYIQNKGTYYPDHSEIIGKWIVEDRQKAKGGAF